MEDLSTTSRVICSACTEVPASRAEAHIDSVPRNKGPLLPHGENKGDQPEYPVAGESEEVTSSNKVLQETLEVPAEMIQVADEKGDHSHTHAEPLKQAGLLHEREEKAAIASLAVLPLDHEFTNSSLVVSPRNKVTASVVQLTVEKEQDMHDETLTLYEVVLPCCDNTGDQQKESTVPQDKMCLAMVPKIVEEVVEIDILGEICESEDSETPSLEEAILSDDDNRGEQLENTVSSLLAVLPQDQKSTGSGVSLVPGTSEPHDPTIQLKVQKGHLPNNEGSSLKKAVLLRVENRAEQQDNTTSSSLAVRSQGKEFTGSDVEVPRTQTSEVAATTPQLTVEKGHPPHDEILVLGAVVAPYCEIIVDQQEEATVGASPVLPQDNLDSARVYKLLKEGAVTDLPEEICQLQNSEIPSLEEEVLVYGENVDEQQENTISGSSTILPQVQEFTNNGVMVPQRSEILALGEVALPCCENIDFKKEESTEGALASVTVLVQEVGRVAFLEEMRELGDNESVCLDEPMSHDDCNDELQKGRTDIILEVLPSDENFATVPQILKVSQPNTHVSGLTPNKRKGPVTQNKDRRKVTEMCEDSENDVAVSGELAYGNDLKGMILSRPLADQMKLMQEILESMPRDKVQEIIQNLHAKEVDDIESQTKKRKERKRMIWSLVASTVSSVASHVFLFILSWKFGEERRSSLEQIRGTSKQWLKWAVNKLIAPVLLCSMLVGCRVYVIDPEERGDPQPVYRHNQVVNLFVNSLSKVVFFAIKEIPGAEYIALLIAHIASFLIDTVGAFLLWWKRGYHDPDVADS